MVVAATDANVADYSLAAIEYRPGPLDKVGKVQAGMLCLPKGKLRWRDVARLEDDVLLRRLSTVLSDNGLSVAPSPDPLFGDAAPVTRFRIRVVVETVSLRLCVAGLGIGEKKPSGEGHALVRWETYDRANRVRSDATAFDVPLVVGGRDARAAIGVVSDALVESAVRYAASRR